MFGARLLGLRLDYVLAANRKMLQPGECENSPFVKTAQSFLFPNLARSI